MGHFGVYWDNEIPIPMVTLPKAHLTGVFRHYLDDKNRVTIPSQWRNLFDKETTFLAIPNPGGYASVLPPIEADKLYDKFAAIPHSDEESQDDITAFMAATQAFKFDSQGRISLSEILFNHVGLVGPKEEVVLVGSSNKFNIYSPLRWAQVEAKSTKATQADVMKRFSI
jgi:MraZ protein